MYTVKAKVHKLGQNYTRSGFILYPGLHKTDVLVAQLRYSQAVN